MCEESEKHHEFIKCCYDSIFAQHEISKGILKYLRINIVRGARTLEHTDTMRGPTDNFMLIEPGSGFRLRVRMFPKFRSSVVLYERKKYIPNEISNEGLIMIGEIEWGKRVAPMYYRFHESVIDDLKPFDDLEMHVVTWKITSNIFKT